MIKVAIRGLCQEAKLGSNNLGKWWSFGGTPLQAADPLRIAELGVEPAHRGLAAIWAIMTPLPSLSDHPLVGEKIIPLASSSMNIWVDAYPLTQNVCWRGEDMCHLPSTFLGPRDVSLRDSPRGPTLGGRLSDRKG